MFCRISKRKYKTQLAVIYGQIKINVCPFSFSTNSIQNKIKRDKGQFNQYLLSHMTNWYVIHGLIKSLPHPKVTNCQQRYLLTCLGLIILNVTYHTGSLSAVNVTIDKHNVIGMLCSVVNSLYISKYRL